MFAMDLSHPRLSYDQNTSFDASGDLGPACTVRETSPNGAWEKSVFLGRNKR